MDKVTTIPILKKGKPYDCNVAHVFNLLDAQPENYQLTSAYKREGDEIFDTSGNLIVKKVQHKSTAAKLPYGLKLEGNKIITPSGQLLHDLYQSFGRFQVDQSTKVEVNDKIVGSLAPKTKGENPSLDPTDTKGQGEKPPAAPSPNLKPKTDEEIEAEKKAHADSEQKKLESLNIKQLDELADKLSKKHQGLADTYDKSANKAAKVQALLNFV